MLSIVEFIIWFATIYVIVSIYENLVHKIFMHNKFFPKRAYDLMPYLIDVFESHAVRHHAIWYRKFDYEPDPVGHNENLKILYLDLFSMLLVTSPVWGALMWFNTAAGIFYIGLFFLHRFLWNTLHCQMHIPEDVFFRKWGVYRYLARHHFLHHQDTKKNFNVVFPLADALIGTKATANMADIREMLRLGYLLPRSKRVQQYFQQQGIPVLGANHIIEIAEKNAVSE